MGSPDDQVQRELDQLRQENRHIRADLARYHEAEKSAKGKDASLIDSRRLYRLLFEHMTVGLAYHEILLDDAGKPVDYRFLQVNPAFERLTGLRAEEVIGKRVLEVLPETEPVWIERYGKVALTGEPVAFENVSQELGKHFDVMAFRTAPGHFATVFQDVTERVEAEAALRERESVLSSFYDSPGTMRGIVELLDDDILHISDNAVTSAFFGRSPRDLQNRRASELGVSSATIQMWLHHYLQAREHGQPVQFEYEHEERRLLATVSHLGRVAGEADRYAYVVDDITERYLARRQLEESNNQLETAVDQLIQAQERLVHHARLNALSQMVTGIAHDLNNALTPIIGYADLISANGLLTDDRGKKYLGRIRTGAENASQLVRQMREFSRGKTDADESEPVDLNEIVAEVAALTESSFKAQSQLSGRSIQLSLDLQDIPPVTGDAAQLREAVTNLVLNGIEAMPDGGELRLATEKVGNQVQLSVRDEGKGMSAEERTKCFEPFFTTKGVNGTGLGLAMVYGIVSRHDGTVEVYTSPGEGAEFVLRFPVCATPLPASAAADATADTRALRILLVEDEPVVREVVADMLSLLGHEVTARGNPREALEEFQPEAIDLVVTDRAMPQMTGDELAQSIRKQAPRLPIIMLTGFGDLMDAAGERPSAIDYILGKPTTPRELETAIHTACSSKPS